eukprot:scaffold10846_cov32-Tisochrysis_lutea.AAC.4
MLVGDQVVRVMPSSPPVYSVALPGTERIAHCVVPADQLVVAALKNGVVQVIMRRPATHVKAEGNKEAAERGPPIMKQVEADYARKQCNAELDDLINGVRVKAADVVQLLCERGKVLADL